MSGSCDSSYRVSLLRAALGSRLALAATLSPFVPAIAGAPLTLEAETSDTPPGFHLGDLSRYLALHMAQARLADWRFEPAADNGLAPDRVQWSFKMDPYAGGEVRNFIRPHMAESPFGAYRSVTLEAKLYLNTRLSSRSRRSSGAAPTMPFS